MSAAELLRAVVSRLNDAGIPFMLTGSLAAAVHGAARATLDIDLVIEADAAQLRTLVSSLSGLDLYVSSDAALEALERQSMFNVVDVRTGWKIDLIIRRSRPFSEAEFARREPIEYEGIELWVATLEDLILAKLEWARLSGSARQIEDVASLLRIAAGAIDRTYLDRWIDSLGVRAHWELARATSESS